MAPRKTPARGASPGVDHPRAIFTAPEIREMRRLAKKGWSQREIAAHLAEAKRREIRHTHVGKILRGELYASEKK